MVARVDDGVVRTPASPEQAATIRAMMMPVVSVEMDRVTGAE